MDKRILILVAGIIAVSGLFFLLADRSKRQQQVNIPNEPKTKVAASFYPLYYFASQIGSDKAVVTNLTPAGAEPHDYEPTASDIAGILQSKLLIVNSAGLEPWVDKLKDDLAKNSVNLVNASEGISLLNKSADDDNEEHLSEIDPHLWLNPRMAKIQADKILQGFINVDPGNRIFYENNTADLKSRLDLLDQDFRQGLSNCNLKSFVTSHNAFAYLASEYGLSQVPISGLSPEAEPSAQDLASISQFAKDNNIKYIFFETLVSPRLSETIAREINAQTLVLDPLEGLSNAEINLGESYFSVMQDNLNNLKIALQCQ